MKPKTLADRLREVMIEHKPPLTQEVVAERVGVTPQAVSGWLRGAVPYPSTLNKICLALGVRRDWLLYGEGEKDLPKLESVVQEMPSGYSRREKLKFIEEHFPEALPVLDSFLDNLAKEVKPKPGGAGSPPKKKARRVFYRTGRDASGFHAFQ